MIAHLVLFKLKPGVGRGDERVAGVVAAMERLPQQIESIRAWEHGWNETPEADAYDYGLRALFDTREALHAYFEDPAHMPVVEQWNEISNLVFCDFKL